MEDRGAVFVASDAIQVNNRNILTLTFQIRVHMLQDSRIPSVPVGVQRMESYRSISAFLGNNSSDIDRSISLLDSLGTHYISLSTDEQVTTSPTAIRLLNSVAGKMKADYMNKMATVAMSIQGKIVSD